MRYFIGTMIGSVTATIVAVVCYWLGLDGGVVWSVAGGTGCAVSAWATTLFCPDGRFHYFVEVFDLAVNAEGRLVSVRNGRQCQHCRMVER